jgi:hypothetical protein
MSEQAKHTIVTGFVTDLPSKHSVARFPNCPADSCNTQGIELFTSRCQFSHHVRHCSIDLGTLLAPTQWAMRPKQLLQYCIEKEDAEQFQLASGASNHLLLIMLSFVRIALFIINRRNILILAGIFPFQQLRLHRQI